MRNNKTSDPHIGYYIEQQEKLTEYRTYLQVLPYYDRLRLCINNVAGTCHMY